MKSIFYYTLFSMLLTNYSFAQESMEMVMEKRAREMQRVINSPDRPVWIKFIKENYTQALIDKQQTMKVAGDASTAVSSTKEMNEVEKLEAKANMFARLHDDFGGSKITSIKTNDENLEMVLNNGSGLIGTFKLRFDKNKPYLIDGIGIEAGN